MILTKQEMQVRIKNYMRRQKTSMIVVPECDGVLWYDKTKDKVYLRFSPTMFFPELDRDVDTTNGKLVSHIHDSIF